MERCRQLLHVVVGQRTRQRRERYEPRDGVRPAPQNSCAGSRSAARGRGGGGGDGERQRQAGPQKRAVDDGGRGEVRRQPVRAHARHVPLAFGFLSQSPGAHALLWISHGRDLRHGHVLRPSRTVLSSAAQTQCLISYHLTGILGQLAGYLPDGS